MTNQSKVTRTLLLFFIALILGTCATFFWSVVGDHWTILADGEHYIALYEGRLTTAPFGYRILTPFLASCLPWGAENSFGVVTITCLVLATGITALYAARSGAALTLIVSACLFWVTSYPFVYYGTTLIRADGPMLLLLAMVFLLSHRQVSTLTLIALIVLGALSHETMLICIPALWIDKFFSEDLTGGSRYKYSDLLIVTVCSIAIVGTFRLATPTLPAQYSYFNGIAEVVSHAIEYSGGWLKHILRIYASYGPVLLYALFFVTPWQLRHKSVGFLILFLMAVGATFLATDTLRVMAIIYLPVIYYAAKYVNELWQSGSRITAVLCLAIQLSYSYTVYGHLRTIKSSFMLNAIAAGLSFLALAVSLLALYRTTLLLSSKKLTKTI